MRLGPQILAAFAALAIPATLQAQDPLTTLIEQWESSFNAGDYAATAALYTPDAVRYPPGADPQEGRAAIEADLPNYADLTIDLEIVGSEDADGFVAAWGTYALYPRTGEASDPVQNGPWMNVAIEGGDGSWLIYRDIWNLRQQP
jgi:ketosteroid isomerase-like protein